MSCKYYGDDKNFAHILLNLIKPKMSKSELNSFLSSVIRHKKADHISQMPGLGALCDYLLYKFNSKIKFKLSCFVGHPL